ncbi:MAG: hypothetical protein C4348_00100 [Patescibacteria group bacterium]
MGLATSFSPLPPILCVDNFWECILGFVTLALKFSMWFSMIFATFMLIYAGILYASKPEEAKKTHERIIWAIVGFVIALLSFSLIVFIEKIITKGKVSLQGIFLINYVFAQQLPTIKPPTSINCGGVTIKSSLITTELPQDAWKICLFYLISQILKAVYWLALFLAVFFLIWTGYNYIYYPEKSKELHKNILYIIIGVVVAILSFTIVKLIELFFRSSKQLLK